MKQIYSIVVLVFSLAVVFPATSYDAHSEFRDDFTRALLEESTMKMEHHVEMHMRDVPMTINKVLGEALAAEGAERPELFFLAERMAFVYREKSGETGELRKVKRALFEERISEPVVSVKRGGKHSVDMPRPTEGVKNFFAPDNIVIRKGDTISWTNTDEEEHIFASIPFLGKKGIFSPSVEAGKSWEYTFNESGEYYYLCFIHKSMVGKITVLDR